MILSVHALFGAAVVSVFPTHPVAAFALGFLSHLAIDTIPHRDYDLISITSDQNQKMILKDSVDEKKYLIRDISLVALDALVGTILALILFLPHANIWAILFAVAGSFLPDFLTFLYLLIKNKFLVMFYNFHTTIHTKTTLRVNQITGVFIQFATIGVLIGALFIVKFVLVL